MTSAAPDGSKVTLDPSMTRVDNQVPVQTRSERFHSTNPADFAAVTGREAEWRLSPVKELSALIDGPLDGGDYPIEAEPPAGVTVGFVDTANSTRCDALLVDTISRSDTYPAIDIRVDDVVLGHEATVSKVSEEQLFYLQSRGLPEDEAMAMIVRGFIEPIARELPMEYALELNKLIEMNMEGSVG